MEVLEVLSLDNLHKIESYVRTGQFVLASNAVTTVYYDVKGALCDPTIGPELIDGAVNRTAELSKGKDITIAVKGYGGMLIGARVAERLGMPLIVFRPTAQDHGTEDDTIRPNRFFPNVVIIDDVRSTGSSINYIEQKLNKIGSHTILGAVVVIDRKI